MQPTLSFVNAINDSEKGALKEQFVRFSRVVFPFHQILTLWVGWLGLAPTYTVGIFRPADETQHQTCYSLNIQTTTNVQLVTINNKI